MQRVAPSDTILRKFLEMWAFTLKIKEKILKLCCIIKRVNIQEMCF